MTMPAEQQGQQQAETPKDDGPKQGQQQGGSTTAEPQLGDGDIERVATLGGSRD